MFRATLVAMLQLQPPQCLPQHSSRRKHRRDMEAGTFVAGPSLSRIAQDTLCGTNITKGYWPYAGCDPSRAPRI
jgi:hypothetical protein